MAANVQDGISSLGIKFGYALETTPGTKPTAFTQLRRINSIGEVTIDQESIDASALEDFESKYVEGRGTTTDKVDVVFNTSDGTIDEWEEAIDEYANRSNKQCDMWFTIWSPFLTKAFFFRGGLPRKLNIPAQDQNALETMTVSIVMHSLEDMAEGIEPTRD